MSLTALVSVEFLRAGRIPAGVSAALPCLTSEPVVQRHVHRVLHDGQELSGEQRVPLPPAAVQHPAVPQLHHQTQLPQGEGLRQVATPQGSHCLPHGQGGLNTSNKDDKLRHSQYGVSQLVGHSFVVEFPLIFLTGFYNIYRKNVGIFTAGHIFLIKTISVMHLLDVMESRRVFLFQWNNLGHNFVMGKKNVCPETPPVENHCFNTLSAPENQFTDSKRRAGNLSGWKS